VKIDTEALRVKPGEKLSLEDRPTEVAPLYESKEAYEDALKDHAKALEKRHERLYANARHAALVVFQGMDTAGKDGAIKHTMMGVNPQGCRVVSFKAPTPTELRHDFLWRVEANAPERGAIAIFNRSHYESVLIERVHPILLENEGFDPPKNLDAFFDARLRAIRDFERNLAESGTCIVKIFLHISRDEQRKRLLARLDDEEKNWKASMSDVEERGYWKDYQRAYEQALSATSVDHAPWFVVPADDKKNARLYVSEILIDALSALPIKTPKPDAARRKELKAIWKMLEE
jgi:PPK2 family polyphosphate:nucleotide phosphotransferase